METRAQKRANEEAYERTNPFKWMIDQIIRFRYLIGLIFLILIVALNLNGSSIGSWDKIVSERSDNKTSDVIFGENREVRSDEWMVQTPFYFSQAESDYPVVNKQYGKEGQNMIIAYNSPVKDWTVIGKPFNWGFLFLGKERGLSFYWGFKIIGMLLLSFEMVMILTKRNKYLSLLGSFWLTFSPAIQWWFMQHVGDLIFFTLAIMVASYHYIANHEKKLLRLFMMGLIVINGIGFVLVLYPAHQVPLVYLIVFWLLGTLIHFRKELVLDIWDLPIIIGGLGIIGIVLFHFYNTSKDAIDATLNTIYPGRREASGGGRPPSDYFYFLTNWKLPFADFKFHGTNNGEVASYFNFFPLTVLLSPFIIFTKQGKEEKYLGAILGLFCCFMFGWTFFGYSHSIAKVLMLTYVTSTRGLVTLGFGSVLLSLWMIHFIWEYVRVPGWVKLIFLGLILALANHSLVTSVMGLYFNRFEMLMTLIVFALILFSLLFKLKKIFLLTMSLVVLASGIFVNPVVHGTGAIDKKTLAEEIVRIKKEDPEAVWLSEGDLYNFTPALGVNTINSVRFYPDMKLWHKIDPKHKHEKIYNRYAHTRAFITADKTKFYLDRPDNFTVNINFTDCKKLGIKYVISNRPLQDYNPLNYAQFEQIYGPDEDKWSIYQLSFTSGDTQATITEDPVGGTEDYQEIPQQAPNDYEYIN
ncbi:hypothetical protein P7D52_00600 [Enterococcus dongliensis]|uniref:YkoY family integral membrane protein n=1 Tax=Enterococcus dongliensis TaxID=2559925 RepID=A0AAW8TFS5_9ENTE|nr:hypothetical protein [Enterococcus dongliensis]MDT2633467.1 hypothetical protein [Enterococcus dongliensis]MDT2636159.1 hypothetical protein [Enterococcus dongliensis]MDT2638934.1 hypothetical protein [Enterococcus dongliensis]MDT2641311.1 hypothetical protein [Enterococcus dongliensis]MDT2645319.1 hypothetical protein [Enterococcus dongliensis]